MTVSLDIQGLALPPTEPYLVGREKVREFADAVHASPLHSSPPSGEIAPPTFPIVIQQRTLDQLLAQPGTGIDFSRVVHGDQSFDFARPIVAGDELTGRLTVTRVATLGGNSMVTAETVITDAAGDLVVTAVSTLVVRGDE